MIQILKVRWSKREALEGAPPLGEWPSIELVGMFEQSNDRSRHGEMIANRVEAITMLVAGKTYREITKITGLHRPEVYRLFKRCLEIAHDGRIWGFRALLPYAHLQPNVRRSEIGPKRQEQQGGMSCALAQILERFPELEGALVESLKRKRRNKPADYRPTKVAMVRMFHDALRRRNVSEGDWPFLPKYKGERTIQRYMDSVLQNSFDDAVGQTGSEEAKAHAATGKGIVQTIPYSEPFDAVEIDAYHIDAFLCVEFETLDLTITEVPVERLWLLAVVERKTTAVLAYSIVYASEVRAEDVAALIRAAIVDVWKPKVLTVPLTYADGSGLPSGVIPEAAHAVWSITMLDGALANLATKIHDVVRKKAAFLINWGAPGHFEHRPNVEMTFRKISRDVFHRLPSTTGSGPKKGRAPDAEEAAERFKIRADEAEQLVDIYFAEHNATPGERNYFNSPLEMLRQYLCGDAPRCMPRTLPPHIGGGFRLTFRELSVTVRGSVRSGRRPYVQFEHVRYTSPLLSDSPWLLGKKLVIWVDDNDLRQVRAFLSGGQEYGILVAQAKWGVTKHNLTTRKAIFRLVYKRILMLSQTGDPIQCYLDYLASKSEKKGKRKGPAPKEATEQARVANDAGVKPRLGKAEGERQRSLHIETISKVPAESVMCPLPEGFFTIKNRRSDR
ncbi:hypothetical protein [Burkholderia diffusa]|uniref:hypothetical protein n=1 Tax=Burkholderia diffusa TaxID=488732 RepID=UPI00157ABD4D|nr:hypothetical protein [Burkholderia diffusa]NTY39852.1 hypothetical protein [Burkholderia diffusa]